MFRNKEQILWQKKQALWFKSCSATHNLFCNCGDWITHIRKRWEGTGFQENFTKHGGHVVDAFIIKGGGDGFPTEDISEEGALHITR